MAGKWPTGSCCYLLRPRQAVQALQTERPHASLPCAASRCPASHFHATDSKVVQAVASSIRAFILLASRVGSAPATHQDLPQDAGPVVGANTRNNAPCRGGCQQRYLGVHLTCWRMGLELLALSAAPPFASLISPGVSLDSGCHSAPLGHVWAASCRLQ